MPDIPDVLPVIFRKSSGVVSAVFPTLPWDRQGYMMTIYEHVGQHGSGSFNWYNTTKAARPDEYADLLRELRGIYETSLAPGDPVYTLKVYKKMTPQHRDAFYKELEG